MNEHAKNLWLKVNRVLCKEPIGNFAAGETYSVKVTPCSGRIFSGHDDIKGTPDNRLMIYTTAYNQQGYTCQDTAVLNEHFQVI